MSYGIGSNDVLKGFDWNEKHVDYYCDIKFVKKIKKER